MLILTDGCLSGGGCAGEPGNILTNPRPTVGVEQSTSCFTCLCTQLTAALVCTLLPGGCTAQRSGVRNTDKQQNRRDQYFRKFLKVSNLLLVARILCSNVEGKAHIDQSNKCNEKHVCFEVILVSF